MSIALRTKLRSLSAAHLLRSFSSSSYEDVLDQPPEPIPNNPLRKQSSYPSPPSPRIPNHNRGRKIETQHSSRAQIEADFLERFKLGFDSKVENPKIKPDKPDYIAEEPLSPPDDADEIFKKMKETGLIPNVVAMLDGLCKDGLVQDEMKLFGLMREKGTIPEVVVYTAVVEGFCKAHRFDDAIRIFKKMQSNGVVPNAFSYQVLIKGLCSGGKRLEDAFLFTIGMLEAGHSPNLATFTGLVDGYCRERGPEDARKVFDEMRVKGFFIEEKQAREYLNMNGPFLPSVWEFIPDVSPSPVHNKGFHNRLKSMKGRVKFIDIELQRWGGESGCENFGDSFVVRCCGGLHHNWPFRISSEGFVFCFFFPKKLIRKNDGHSQLEATMVDLTIFIILFSCCYYQFLSSFFSFSFLSFDFYGWTFILLDGLDIK